MKLGKNKRYLCRNSTPRSIKTIFVTVQIKVLTKLSMASNPLTSMNASMFPTFLSPVECKHYIKVRDTALHHK